MAGPIRWRATVYYRTSGGLVDVAHELSELNELGDAIELGPDWACIERIEVAFIADRRRMTVEEAALL